VPPGDDSPRKLFRGLVLTLRGRIGLTQSELAARVGVHVHSVRGWETGTHYPGVASLQSLIEASLALGGFTVMHEAGEAAELWQAALRESPRLRAPFDRAWFDQISAGSRRPIRSDAAVVVPTSGTTTGAAQRQSWGEAPDVSVFLGRSTEREQVARWMASERCRVVAVYGLGGIGKTLLATRLAHDLAPSFDRV
jgi:transcriptional regulator with XRE-family HTH domain